jgi:hypothetical protein
MTEQIDERVLKDMALVVNKLADEKTYLLRLQLDTAILRLNKITKILDPHLGRCLCGRSESCRFCDEDPRITQIRILVRDSS